MVIVKLAAAGSMVKKGDMVAQFDPQWEIDHTDDARANLLQLRAGMDKRKAELAIDNEVFEQQLRAARADQDKARLDLKTAEVRSLIDAEKLKLAVQETEARYQQLLKSVKLRATSQEAEVRELDMRYRREETHIDRHLRNIERASVKAPIDGLVVMQTVNRREQGQISQVQEGDQVAPGTYFMQIVDLSSMVMSGTVNQADSHLLGLGQKAVIRLEAYPDLELPGRVISIGAMASAGSGGRGGRGGRETYVRQVPIKLALEGTDPRVIPDLSASADIHLKVDPNVLQVPRSTVVEQDGKKYVRVKESDQFQNREVQLGDYNHTHYVVTAGLSEGAEVALR
jgi:multidrug efflux pump subunit AcrA (membrane-fusion protein)